MSKSRVLVLDGDFYHSLAVFRELKEFLDIELLALGSGVDSYAFRSRYVDHAFAAPPPGSEAYLHRLLEIVQAEVPDVVLPVGFASTDSVRQVLERFPAGVAAVVPPLDGFAIAMRKRDTYSFAEGIGLRVPREIGMVGGDASWPVGDLEFPLFAKAACEQGGESTALIESRENFDRFPWGRLGPEVLLQEYVDGDRYTYAVNGYYEDGDPVVTYQHVEKRSVPRRGGSATRLESFFDPELARLANSLMGALRWDGVAQIEFKRNRFGEFVLMEINPKLWASYAFARKCGRPIAAVAVSRVLGVAGPEVAGPAVDSRMAFPVRELEFLVQSPGESGLLQSLAAMFGRGLRWDISLRDFRAHFPSLGRVWRKFVGGSSTW